MEEDFLTATDIREQLSDIFLCPTRNLDNSLNTLVIDENGVINTEYITQFQQAMHLAQSTKLTGATSKNVRNEYITKRQTLHNIHNKTCSVDVCNVFAMEYVNSKLYRASGNGAGKRAIVPLELLSNDNDRNKRLYSYWEVIIQLLANSGQNLLSMIALLLCKNPSVIRTLLTVLIEMNPKHYTEIIGSVTTITPPDANTIVALKDNRAISDTTYDEMYKLGLKYLWPAPYAVEKARRDLNKEAKQIFKITRSEENICTLDPKTVLPYFETMGNFGDDDVIEVKVGFDAASKGFTAGTMILLNGKDIATQSPANCIPFMLYKGKEELDSLEKGLTAPLLRLDSLASEKYLFFMCNDLSAMAKISDLLENGLFCPFCDCHKDHRHKFFEHKGKPRKLKIFIRGIFFNNFIPMICALHCTMRCTDNLFVLLLKSITLEQLKLIEDRMRKRKGFSQFQFRTTARTETEDDYDQSDVKLPYMNGKQVKIVLEFHEEIFSGVYDEVEAIIWSIMRVVLMDYVQGTTEQLKEPIFNTTYLRKILLALARILKFRYPGQKFAYYLHIVIEHMPELIEEYESLTKFSKEVDESKHCEIERKATRITSAGGPADANKLEQVMLINCRRLLLTEDYDVEYNTEKEFNDFQKQEFKQKQVKWLTEIAEYVDKLTASDYETYLHSLQKREHTQRPRITKRRYRKKILESKTPKKKMIEKAKQSGSKRKRMIEVLNASKRQKIVQEKSNKKSVHAQAILATARAKARDNDH